MRAKRIDASEQDAFSRYWRPRVFWQRRELKKIKRKFNKRQRQDAKRAIRNEEA